MERKRPIQRLIMRRVNRQVGRVGGSVPEGRGKASSIVGDLDVLRFSIETR